MNVGQVPIKLRCMECGERLIADFNIDEIKEQIYKKALEDVLKEIIDLYDSGMTGLDIRKYCVERVEELKSEGEE